MSQLSFRPFIPSVLLCLFFFLLIPFFLFASGSPTPPPPPPTFSYADCHIFRPGSAIPENYGASYSIYTGEPLITASRCFPNQIEVRVGNDSEDAETYVYSQAYYYNGQQWVMMRVGGSPRVGDWIAKTGIVTIPYVGERTWFVAYTCEFVDNEFRCGCRDAACATPHWQAQGFVSPWETPAEETVSRSDAVESTQSTQNNQQRECRSVTRVTTRGEVYVDWEPAGCNRDQNLSGGRNNENYAVDRARDDWSNFNDPEAQEARQRTYDAAQSAYGAARDAISNAINEASDSHNERTQSSDWSSGNDVY